MIQIFCAFMKLSKGIILIEELYFSIQVTNEVYSYKKILIKHSMENKKLLKTKLLKKRLFSYHFLFGFNVQ